MSQHAMAPLLVPVGRSADVTAAGSALAASPTEVMLNPAGCLEKRLCFREAARPPLGSKQHLSPKVQSASTVLLQTQQV